VPETFACAIKVIAAEKTTDDPHNFPANAVMAAFWAFISHGAPPESQLVKNPYTLPAYGVRIWQNPIRDLTEDQVQQSVASERQSLRERQAT
jgi:hypothetical protein